MNFFKTLLLAFVALSFTACEGLFFYPDKMVYSDPTSLGLSYDNYTIYSEDKTALDAWHVKPKGKSKGLFVLAHGNAQNMSAHFKDWTWIVEAGYELFIFDYRAYGKSMGEISLKGSVEDVTAVLSFVEKKFQKSYFLCGQSLGGTLVLASLKQRARTMMKALIIDSTFTSFSGIASEKLGSFFLTWPFKWMSYFMFPKGFDAEKSIVTVTQPVLFLHGSKDQTIPANHSWQLFELSNKPKEFWIITQAKHIQALQILQVRKDFLHFLEKVKKRNYYHKNYSFMKIYDNL